MRKLWTLIIVLVLLAGALVTAPLLIGYKIEPRLQQELTKMNKISEILNGDDYQATKITEFKRGWFHSTMTISDPKESHYKIYHGPIVISPKGVKIALAEMIVLNPKTDVDKAFDTTTMQFDGKVISKAKLSSNQLSMLKDKVSFKSAQASIASSLDANTFTISGDATDVSTHDLLPTSSTKKLSGSLAYELSPNDELFFVLNFMAENHQANFGTDANKFTGGFKKLAVEDIRFDFQKIKKLSSINDDGQLTNEEIKLLFDIIAESVTKDSVIELNGLTVSGEGIQLGGSFKFSWPELPKDPTYGDVNWFLQSDVDFSMPKLHIEQDGSSLDIENLLLTINEDNVTQNSVQFSIEKLVDSEADSGTGLIENLKMTGNTSTTANKLSIKNSITLQKGCYTNPPQINDERSCIANSAINFSALNLNEEALKQLYKNLGNIDTQAFATQNVQQSLALISSLGNLIEPDSELILELKSDSDFGKIDIKGSANWKKMTKSQGALGVMAYINYEITGTASAKLVDQFFANDGEEGNGSNQDTLQSLIDSKILTKQGDSYKIDYKQPAE